MVLCQLYQGKITMWHMYVLMWISLHELLLYVMLLVITNPVIVQHLEYKDFHKQEGTKSVTVQVCSTIP